MFRRAYIVYDLLAVILLLALQVVLGRICEPAVPVVANGEGHLRPPGCVAPGKVPMQQFGGGELVFSAFEVQDVPKTVCVPDARLVRKPRVHAGFTVQGSGFELGLQVEDVGFMFYDVLLSV